MALEVLRKEDVHVVAFAGDGGTVDIGLQALSGAVERGHRFIYICYDNEAYMNTGIQRSGATPLGAWTTTTPAGKAETKKDIVGMLRAQGIPYIATASAGFMEDFARKVEKAKEIDGPVYIHVLTPCATGWRFPPKETINIARLAVDTGLWPLFEVINGQLRVTRKPKTLKPVSEYIKAQGRFSHVSEEQIQFLTENAERSWQRLLSEEEVTV